MAHAFFLTNEEKGIILTIYNILYKGIEGMDQNLYQKIGVTIGQLAQDFLTRNVGDRIPSVSEYQEKFNVSRGTIQNALAYIKENQAVSLKAHGHMGTYIEGIDYVKLQNCCIREEILGIMPLPYSVTYEGFATAVYEAMKGLNFNMAYSRGAVGRIRLVESGTYQFAVCSQYAAEQAMREGSKIEIVMNFGVGSFLSKHVLMVRDTEGDGITDGMRVGYDSTSLDQSQITKRIVRGKKIELVEIKTQNIISGLKAGVIDAGVWNYDDIIAHGQDGLKVVFLRDEDYDVRFSAAVIIVKKGAEYIKALLEKYISKKRVLKVLEEVRTGARIADY